MSDQAEGTRANGKSGLPEWAREWGQQAIGIVPAALLGLISTQIEKRLAAEPWQTLWELAPGIAGAWVIWNLCRRGGPGRRWGVYPVAGIVLIVFTWAAGARALAGNPVLSGFEDRAPRAWLAPNRLGDWRYQFAHTPRDGRLLIITLPPRSPSLTEDQHRVRRRQDLTNILKLATEHHAIGAALDVHFAGDSDPATDSSLCAAFQTARDSGLEVFVGYGLEVHNGGVFPVRPPPRLRPCLSPDQEAHAAGFVEVDRRVRTVPLFLENNPELPALSLRVASALGKRDGSSPKVPRSHMVQYSRPEPDLPAISLETLLAHPELRDRLRARFLVVGAVGEAKDTFRTPYGNLPGVIVHAYTANNLVLGTAIERGSTLPAVLLGWVIGIQIAIYAARGLSRLGLIGLGVLWSAGIAALTALAMMFANIWVDGIYELVAIWAIVLAAIIWQTLSAGRRRELDAGL